MEGSVIDFSSKTLTHTPKKDIWGIPVQQDSKVLYSFKVISPDGTTCSFEDLTNDMTKYASLENNKKVVVSYAPFSGMSGKYTPKFVKMVFQP
ncbi:MAG TPA: hypothetical protein DD726_08685 [Phycisphaerales bacterium]|nr:hypothetical protein [Phycisphaerales bacterium]